MIKIIIAKNAGFCFGVRNAVNKLYSLIPSKNKIFSFGEIIHNPVVINDLKEKGVIFTENLNEIKNGTVVIRSHGVDKKTFEILSKNSTLIDATCPFVKKIHDIVDKYYNLGYEIIILGQKNHPEVKGINGYCDNNALIFDNEKEIDDAKNEIKKHEKICVVVQTTFSDTLCQNLLFKIKSLAKSVEFFNTICYTTNKRQAEAIELSKSCDCIIVIGGKKSSNTNNLYNICKKFCKNTFFIENVSEAKSLDIKNFKMLGITAGASTPAELIEEVVKVMSESQNAKVLNENDEMTMEEVIANDTGIVSLRAGKIINATVINADENGVFVNIGVKKDGFIDKSELDTEEYNPDNYKSGDKITAVIIENKSAKSEYIALSQKIYSKMLEDEKAMENIINGETFTFVPNKAIKGGLIGKKGTYTIFIPASQIKFGYVAEADLEKFVGKPITLKVIPPKKSKEAEAKEDTQETQNISDNQENEISENNSETKIKKTGKRLVCSHKVILEEEREKKNQEKAIKEKEFWDSISENIVVKGKVKRFANFGAFISVNGFDCLAHISDLSWRKINDPAEVLKIGETYDFLILKADRENNRISLGYKQLQKKPYELAAEKYPVGTVVKGKVERIFPFGAFISLEDGIDGLVHVSQISHKWLQDANEGLKVGDEVEAVVIKFENNKITLSIKELLPPPIEDNESEKEEEKGKKGRKTKSSEGKSDKKSKDEDIKKWISDDGNATIGDLFKDLEIDIK